MQSYPGIWHKIPPSFFFFIIISKIIIYLNKPPAIDFITLLNRKSFSILLNRKNKNSKVGALCGEIFEQFYNVFVILLHLPDKVALSF